MGAGSDFSCLKNCLTQIAAASSSCPQTYFGNMSRRFAAALPLSLSQMPLVGWQKFVRLLRPETDWKFVHAVVRHIYRNVHPTRDNRTRCRPSIEFYELGLQLMEKAEARPHPLARAREFRSGLVISFLAARPLRIRNLAMITLDRHLKLRGESYWVHFEPDETKNGRALDLRWPEPLHSALIFYLTVCRPVLVGNLLKYPDLADKLWAMSIASLYSLITYRTGKCFGQAVNPHLFRHAAATSTAIEDPAHVGIVAAILGHSSFRATEAYYNMATSIEAARRYQKHIVQLRRTGSRR